MRKTLTIRGLDSGRVWDFENGFYWFSDRRRLAKALAHYELYKRIVPLPGDVFECGVYKAASLVRWISFRDSLETTHSRKVVGFDAFGSFPKADVAGAGDLQFIQEFEAEAGDGLTLAETQALLDYKGMSDNVSLQQGDVRTTVPAYLASFPHARIALLHLDVDVYEPTRLLLELLWDRLVPGGCLVVDDYNAVEGATRAIDELLARHPRLKLEKLPLNHVPAFIMKP